MNERILSQLGQAVMETMMLLGKELLRRLVDNRNNGYVVYVGEGVG